MEKIIVTRDTTILELYYANYFNCRLYNSLQKIKLNTVADITSVPLKL